MCIGGGQGLARHLLVHTPSWVVMVRVAQCDIGQSSRRHFPRIAAGACEYHLVRRGPITARSVEGADVAERGSRRCSACSVSDDECRVGVGTPWPVAISRRRPAHPPPNSCPETPARSSTRSDEPRRPSPWGQTGGNPSRPMARRWPDPCQGCSSHCPTPVPRSPHDHDRTLAATGVRDATRTRCRRTPVSGVFPALLLVGGNTESRPNRRSGCRDTVTTPSRQPLASRSELVTAP